MGAFMPDVALEDPIRSGVVTQSNASHLGVAIMVLFALISAIIVFQHPGISGLEYQPVAAILTGR
jgi:hypothetical protein